MRNDCWTEAEKEHLRALVIEGKLDSYKACVEAMTQEGFRGRSASAYYLALSHARGTLSKDVLPAFSRLIESLKTVRKKDNATRQSDKNVKATSEEKLSAAEIIQRQLEHPVIAPDMKRGVTESSTPHFAIPEGTKGKDYITKKEFAAIFSFTDSAVAGMVRRHQIPSITVLLDSKHKLVFYKPAVLAAYEKERSKKLVVTPSREKVKPAANPFVPPKEKVEFVNLSQAKPTPTIERLFLAFEEGILSREEFLAKTKNS